MRLNLEPEAAIEPGHSAAETWLSTSRLYTCFLLNFPTRWYFFSEWWSPQGWVHRSFSLLWNLITFASCNRLRHITECAFICVMHFLLLNYFIIIWCSSLSLFAKTTTFVCQLFCCERFSPVLCPRVVSQYSVAFGSRWVCGGYVSSSHVATSPVVNMWQTVMVSQWARLQD